MLNFSFWILLAANIVLFVFQHSYFSPPIHEKREPERILFQYNPDQIRLLAPDATKKIEEQTNGLPNISQSAVPCLEIGNFDSEEVVRFDQQLTALQVPSDNIIRVPVHESANHIVYIPRPGNKKSTEKTIAELQKNNIKNYYIIQDNSKLKGAISLGVFKTDEAAKKYIAELRQLGIHDVQMGIRETSIEKTLYQLSNFNNDFLQSIDKVMAGFPKQTRHECKPS